MCLKHRAIFEGVEIAASVYYMAGSECLKPNDIFSFLQQITKELQLVAQSLVQPAVR